MPAHARACMHQPHGSAGHTTPRPRPRRSGGRRAAQALPRPGPRRGRPARRARAPEHRPRAPAPRPRPGAAWRPGGCRAARAAAPLTIPYPMPQAKAARTRASAASWRSMASRRPPCSASSSASSAMWPRTAAACCSSPSPRSRSRRCARGPNPVSGRQARQAARGVDMQAPGPGARKLRLFGFVRRRAWVRCAPGQAGPGNRRVSDAFAPPGVTGRGRAVILCQGVCAEAELCCAMTSRLPRPTASPLRRSRAQSLHTFII
jgi:hypothetical protein